MKNNALIQVLVIFIALSLVGCASNGDGHFFKKFLNADEDKDVIIDETTSASIDQIKKLHEEVKTNKGPFELIKEAKGLCERANQEWKRGNTEVAIITLDRAYGIILGIDEAENTEIEEAKKSLRLEIARRLQEIHSSEALGLKSEGSPVPLQMNEDVEREIKSFQGPERRFFVETYKRSGRFRPEIVEVFQREGIPEELSWLPFIESGYNVKAISSARALGLWQFIPSTGYRFGLSRDEWVDERLDPQKSTEAVVLYLKKLHELFGDWFTVLAAYNCGEGKVLTTIREQKINYLDNFWDLYRELPRETAHFVPRFLAVLHILSDPEKYGFNELETPEKPIPYEVVEIEKQVSLKSVASKLDVSCPLLEELNPQLKKQITPDRRFTLKVPLGYSENLLSVIDEIPEYRLVQKARKGRYYPSGGKYKVKKGDSMYRIAKKFGLKMGDIVRSNHLKSTRLRIGQVLVIPSSNNQRTGKRKPQVYKVHPGDNLYVIAKKYNIKLFTLMKKNKLKPGVILHPGQELIIP